MPKPVKKITLVTDTCGYGMYPPPEKEVMQRLTINNKGQVWLCSYLFGNGFDEHVRNSLDRFSVDSEQARHVVNTVARLCDSPLESLMVLDAGMWELTVIFEDGTKRQINGSWVPMRATKGFSDQLRTLTQRADLFAFANHESESMQGNDL